MNFKILLLTLLSPFLLYGCSSVDSSELESFEDSEDVDNLYYSTVMETVTKFHSYNNEIINNLKNDKVSKDVVINESNDFILYLNKLEFIPKNGYDSEAHSYVEDLIYNMNEAINYVLKYNTTKNDFHYNMIDEYKLEVQKDMGLILTIYN